MFDNIDHSLLMKAVRHHTTCSWVLLYTERWLTAPVQQKDGVLRQRTKGTPQGGIVSPTLANLYLHYAFDCWMKREFPRIPFARYADDVICHCSTEAQAKYLKNAIQQRFAACFLELHPQKTKIAYCCDDKRRGTYPVVQFDFLGYSFRPRQVKGSNGDLFVGFNPGISPKSATSIRKVMNGWQLHHRSDLSLDEIARMVNPSLRGWITYYGTYYRSALYRVMVHFDRYLTRWAATKYKSLKHRFAPAARWLRGVALRQPHLFAHWAEFRTTTG